MKYSLLMISIFSCLLSACDSHADHRLKVAATSVPHAEILEKAKPILAEDGVDLDIIIIEDYNTPNRALQEGEIDANFFQHLPFLESQIKDFGYTLEEFTPVHIEPMGLYSKKIHRLDELKNQAKIAIPNDPTNQARALFLLQSQQLIALSKNDLSATVYDIVENPHNFELIEIDPALLSRTLDDVDLAAITTNFALQAGIKPDKEALALESKESRFVNSVVIRHGEADREDLQKLKNALRSKEVSEYIRSRYQGTIIPVNE